MYLGAFSNGIERGEAPLRNHLSLPLKKGREIKSEGWLNIYGIDFANVAALGFKVLSHPA